MLNFFTQRRAVFACAIMRWRIRTGALLIVAFLCSVAWAQLGTGTGAISGLVADPSGAVIANASVEITDTATGTTTALRTNGEGRYTAPSLRPGTYDVVARAQGFSTQKRTQNLLTVGASIVVNFALAVGSSSQTITIAASAAQLETETTEQGATIGETQIRDLPLNGRNLDQLLLQAPGVQPVNTGTQGSFYGRDATISVAGARPEGQYLLLDGADIQGAWGHGAGNIILGSSLGVDAIGEFQVLTGTYSARYGGSGSAMNAATRSGTNKFHGSAYEFIRNNDLDALDYFDNPPVPPTFKKNQFGASLGGPVKKDKAFFFANFEAVEQRQGLTLIDNVPDANAIAGYLPLPSRSVNPAQVRP